MFGKYRESVFSACRDMLSLFPSILGTYIRTAYYWAVCDDVSPDAHFLFGSWLAHRQNTIRAGTVIGHYSFVGYANIEENVIMAARVSIVSGKYQHGHPYQRIGHGQIVEENQVIRIGRNSWIGQDATILANIGENCTVGAGSVVFKDVPNNSTVLGNPARKVNFDFHKTENDNNCTK